LYKGWKIHWNVLNRLNGESLWNSRLLNFFWHLLFRRLPDCQTVRHPISLVESTHLPGRVLNMDGPPETQPTWSSYRDAKITITQDPPGTWTIEHRGQKNEVINVCHSDPIFDPARPDRQTYFEVEINNIPPNASIAIGLQNYLPKQRHGLPGSYPQHSWLNFVVGAQIHLSSTSVEERVVMVNGARSSSLGMTKLALGDGVLGCGLDESGNIYFHPHTRGSWIFFFLKNTLLFNTTARGEFYGIRNVAEGFYQESSPRFSLLRKYFGNYLRLQ
jgi:hypothetical protein